MSSVLRPRGPLPARVYWTRRLLLLTVVVTLLVLVGAWLAPGGRGSEGGAAEGEAAAEGTGSTTAPGDSRTSPPGEGERADRGDRAEDGKADRAGDPGKDGDGDREGRPDRGGEADREDDADRGTGREADGPRSPPTTEPLAAPSGPCDPAEVELTIEVDDSRSGDQNTSMLLFRSLDVPACTLGLTPDTLAIQVTSGSDLIWSSADCPTRLPARQVVARAEPPGVYAFTWSGHRSTRGCGGPGEAALPGGYRVEASLIGGEPAQAYFDVK